MSRARNIKPGFFTNADLLDCQPLARLLFAGLWCEADRRGILEDRPKTLKIKILPGDNCDVDELLNELAEKGFVVRYQVGEFRGLYLPNFGKHQNPHIKEMPSTLPAPDEHSASTVQAPDQHDASPADSLLLIPDSLILIPETREDDGAGAPNPTPEPKPPRETRIPDEFAVDDDMTRWAESKGFSQPEIDHHTEAFVSYWRGEGGPKSRKRDWRQAWQTWLLREKPGRWPGSITQIRPPSKPQLPPVMQPGNVPKDGGLAEWRNAGSSGA